MATLTTWVDPGSATGPGDGTQGDPYLSLSLWEAGEAQDLTDGGGDIAVVNCFSSDGTDDTTAFTLDGFTTGAANYIQIQLDSSETNTGVWNDGNYVFHNNDSSTTGLFIRDGYVRLYDIQVKVTCTAANARTGITYDTLDGASAYIIGRGFFKGVSSSTGVMFAVDSDDANNVIDIFSTIVIDFVSGADSAHRGINVDNGTVNVYNCTIRSCYAGIREVGGTVNVYNTISFDCVSDILGCTVVSYCASDDNTTTDATNIDETGGVGDTWVDSIPDFGTDDFNLVDKHLDNVCNGDPSGGLYSTDIAGTAFAGNWAVGAFELVAAGGSDVPMFWHHLNKNIGR